MNNKKGLFDYSKNSTQNSDLKGRPNQERTFVFWCGEKVAYQLNEFYEKNIKNQ